MMMHSAPVARKTAEAVARFSEADWLEAARLTIVMKGLHASGWPALAVAGVLTALSYRYAPTAALFGVLALTVVVTVLRHYFVRGYLQTLRDGHIDQQLAYLRRRRWFLPLNAVNWGVWPLVFHGHLPPESEVVCWMLTAGVGGVAIAWMSAHMYVTRMFLILFVSTVAISVGVTFIVWPEHLTQRWDAWIPVMLAAYWLMMARIARLLNDLYGQSIDLSYHNARLIHSLREQKNVAEEALRFKDRFLAGAAHDLKQPVNALGIYAEWLSNEPELVHELGPKILQSTQAINALFDSLFDLVKLDAGQFDVDLKPIPVPDLLSDLEVQFGPIAGQKDLELRLRAVPVSVRSDPILLRRVLGNLVANAIRYTVRGGVLLAARQRGDHVLFEVWDTGIGIPEHEQEQVFNEFYKIKTGGTEEGFGLGLAIVRRLSERLDYPVSMRSRPGRGTVFKIRVPVEPSDIKS
ncbi:MAG: HAMP domain-containing sensor histidine kinase [Pseudomonadota bacterium]|nr:HAMP domain-containing sensor histidine kinase [Pseudomonadota bacterium]